MSETYFRVQRADRDVNELLDPGYHFSSAYSRNPSLTRRGVSTCPSLEDLAEYLVSGMAGAIQVQAGSWVVVEMEGDVSSDAPVDAEYETLIIPTAILSVRPVDDGFMDMIAAADAFLASFDRSPDFDDED